MNNQSLSCSPASAGRIAALDAARGFAILAVVASHALLLQEPVASWIYEFYVPLFFVLSGYLASPGHEVTRIGRMAGKYLGVCGTLFAVWFVMYPLRGEQTDLTGRAVASILYGRFYDTASPLLVNCCWSGQLWFLTLLCTASALFFALRRLPDRPAVRIAVLAGLLAAAQLLRAAPVLLLWCVDTAPLGAAYMLAGSWLARRDFARKPFRGWHPALLAACLAAYLALHDTYDLNLRVYGRFADLRGPAAFFAAGTAGSVLCIALCTVVVRIPWVGKILCCAGRHSMGVFCWHIFWLWVVDALWMRLPASWPTDGLWMRLAYAVVVLAAVPLLCTGTDALYKAAGRWLAGKMHFRKCQK